MVSYVSATPTSCDGAGHSVCVPQAQSLSISGRLGSGAQQHVPDGATDGTTVPYQAHEVDVCGERMPRPAADCARSPAAQPCRAKGSVSGNRLRSLYCGQPPHYDIARRAHKGDRRVDRHGCRAFREDRRLEARDRRKGPAPCCRNLADVPSGHQHHPKPSVTHICSLRTPIIGLEPQRYSGISR